VITDEMVEAFGRAWHATPAGEPGARRRAGLAAALEVFADQMEAPESSLCDCSAQEGNTPVSPATGQPMAHHCECRAVQTSAFFREGRTLHARACAGVR
jgi:hypothetical protein